MEPPIMPASAGETIVAPYQVTTVATESSDPFTTEAVVDTIVTSLVNGETYEIIHYGHWQSYTAADSIITRIREDDTTAGTLKTYDYVSQYLASGIYGVVMYCQYTATTTGAKSFCASGSRQVGSGSCIRYAVSSCPTYFVCRRI
jgi:hypothetical protein